MRSPDGGVASACARRSPASRVACSPSACSPPGSAPPVFLRNALIANLDTQLDALARDGRRDAAARVSRSRTARLQHDTDRQRRSDRLLRRHLRARSGSAARVTAGGRGEPEPALPRELLARHRARRRSSSPSRSLSEDGEAEFRASVRRSGAARAPASSTRRWSRCPSPPIEPDRRARTSASTASSP